ncbi:unnamed protein product, partial [Discosporangium mesarthrocarpum]
MCLGLRSFEGPASLVDFMLELCEGDLRLAHKVHWLLKAFCSPGPRGPERRGASSFALQVRERGCLAANRLSRTLGDHRPRPPPQEGIFRLLPRVLGGGDVWGGGAERDSGAVATAAAAAAVAAAGE